MPEAPPPAQGETPQDDTRAEVPVNFGPYATAEQLAEAKADLERVKSRYSSAKSRVFAKVIEFLEYMQTLGSPNSGACLSVLLRFPGEAEVHLGESAWRVLSLFNQLMPSRRTCRRSAWRG